MREKWVSHDLQYNVAQLLKEGTGATRSYDVNSDLKIELGEDVTLVSPLTGQLNFLRAGSTILVTGSLNRTIQKSCGRCLAAFEIPVFIELEEEFYPVIDIVTGTPLPESAQADLANQIGEQNILDLLEVVRQELVVESDSILYCRPDCQGLCPHCGQDRNVNLCDCQEDRLDPRWAGLLALQEE